MFDKIMKHVQRLLPAGLIFIVMFTSCIHADDTPAYRHELVMVQLSDSIRLATEVYLPAADGQYPVILLRSPYGGGGKHFLGEYFAPHGYAVVIQYSRGTNGSEGEYFPFAYAKPDGMETLEWISQQPWFGGKIGLWGVSIQGFNAFELAATGHPLIKTMFYNSSWADLQSFMTHGGAFQLRAHLKWFITFMAGESAPPPQAWDGIFRAVPINQWFRGADAVMDDLAAAPYSYADFTIPILHATGWYDYIYPNSLGAYNAIKANSPDAGPQKLVIGPWAHNDMLNGKTAVGNEDFGPEAMMGLEKTLELSKRWFDYHLKGIDNGITSEPAVKVFVMGENQWREFDTWPPPTMVEKRWYLGSDGNANGSAGSGTLSLNKPTEAVPDTFTFDPHNPVPTTGGANSHFFPDDLGSKDQTEVEKRPDVLVYTSPPLTQDLVLVGPIKVELYAATEGKDTDFTAKLVAVQPDGYSRNVEDGIIRGRYSQSMDSAKFLEPGQVYKFDIGFGATAIKLEKGNRLRVEISSSNFPKYDRNPNTGEDPFSATEFISVKQTVYHTAKYPSCIILPALESE